jgi:hypothetical protein
MREAFLGTDGRADLGFEVERDAELALVQIGDGQPQLGNALARRVPMVTRIAHGLDQLVDGNLGRRDVGVAERQVDDVLAGPPELHFQCVDLCECIRRECVDPAKLHPSSVGDDPRYAGQIRNGAGYDPERAIPDHWQIYALETN